MYIPTNHVLFIPLVLGVGFVVGYLAGVHATRRAWAREKAMELQSVYAARRAPSHQDANSVANDGSRRSSDPSG